MMQYNIPPFKIGCASIHMIMTEPQGKSIADKIKEAETKIEDETEKLKAAKEGSKTETNIKARIEKLNTEIDSLKLEEKNEIKLSKTTKTYCRLWVKSHLYGKKQLFSSRYTDKGNIVEDESISYIEMALRWDNEFVIKNELKKENDFLKGICDINLREKIVDTKNSYDCFTFPLFDDEDCDTNYEWQGQGYMELYNKPQCEIIYVLMDTPESLIKKEARWKLGNDYTEEQYESFRSWYIYSNCADELRIRRFKFTRDEEKIKQIRQRVAECQQYINLLIEQLKNRKLNV